MTNGNSERLGKASGLSRRLLALLLGLLATVTLVVSGTGPASAQNVVGPQPFAMILTVGTQTTAAPESIGVHPLPLRQQASATGVAADTGSSAISKIGGPKEFDPNTLKGLTGDDVRARIPSDWSSGPSTSGGGEVFTDPANAGRQVRIMPGYGAGTRPDPITAGPYAVVSQNGVTVKVPLFGNPTLP